MAPCLSICQGVQGPRWHPVYIYLYFSLYLLLVGGAVMAPCLSICQGGRDGALSIYLSGGPRWHLICLSIYLGAAMAPCLSICQGAMHSNAFTCCFGFIAFVEGWFKEDPLSIPRCIA
jgi:hypothetical protein